MSATRRRMGRDYKIPTSPQGSKGDILLLSRENDARGSRLVQGTQEMAPAPSLNDLEPNFGQSRFLYKEVSKNERLQAGN